jgi:hypothetical protein
MSGDIELIVVRDPDDAVELIWFIDGQPVVGDALTVTEYHVDPGAGHTQADWAETTEADCTLASEACAERLREVRDHFAEHCGDIT